MVADPQDSTGSARGRVRRDEGSLASRSGGAPALHYYTTFPEAAPKAVVGLIHGYAEYGARYAHVADFWAGRGIASIAIDLRGHGRSEGPRGSCEHFGDYLDDASQLESLVRERAPGLPAFLFGHSFGGLVAASLVLTKPAPWRGLLLTAPYLGLALKVSPVKRLAGVVASRLLPTLSLPSGVHGADLTRDPVRARAYDEDPLVFRTANARWFTEAQSAQARAIASARSITAPLLVVMGTADRVADLTSVRAFFESAGSKDKHLDVRDGFFHEILNEPEWRGVAEGLAEWILARSLS
jgi:acylglycerol lipase